MLKTSDFALLGVPSGADEAAVRHAFLQAVKAARPDRGGDPQHYREVIAAYRRLREPAPQEDLDVRMEIRIGAEQARTGGPKLVQLPTGKTVRVTLPAEIKDGRTLRLKRQGLNAPGRWGDVYLTVAVAEPLRTVDRVAELDRVVEIMRPTASVLLRRFAGTWAA